MRIVLYNLNFMPELTGIGKYVFELAVWLVGRGYKVSVICSQPYYPHWRIFDGYKGFSYRHEVIEGIEVFRCPVWVPRSPTGLTRIVHLISFAISSAPMLLFCLIRRPSLIFLTVPTFFCSFWTVLLAKIFGVKAWIHIQDFEVDAAFSMGLLKGRVKRQLAFFLERCVYRGFDRVSTISSRMMELARNKGVPDASLFYFPNWASVTGGKCGRSAASANYRSLLGLPPSNIVALYSGNMGAKQGLELLAEVARRLQSEADISFVFCGNGAGRADLERLCAGLRNVSFLNLQPVEHLGELLNTADIHLLPQRADAADLVMPSKLTGMLASGRPVIATSLPGTEVALVVEGCGLVVPPEDASSFSNAVLCLARDAELRASLGQAGLRYAERYLDINAVLSSFEAEMKSII